MEKWLPSLNLYIATVRQHFSPSLELCISCLSALLALLSSLNLNLGEDARLGSAISFFALLFVLRLLF